MEKQTVSTSVIRRTSAHDLKIIKLSVSFFALCVVLFIIGIYKIETTPNSMPFAGLRDYVVFEKTVNSRSTCMPTEICFENLKVYRSGKVISLGSKMTIRVLSKKDMDRIIAAVDSTQIINKECKEIASNIDAMYTIKLGVEVKRISSGTCEEELQQIESQIFQ